MRFTLTPTEPAPPESTPEPDSPRVRLVLREPLVKAAVRTGAAPAPERAVTDPKDDSLTGAGEDLAGEFAREVARIYGSQRVRLADAEGEPKLAALLSRGAYMREVLEDILIDPATRDMMAEE